MQVVTNIGLFCIFLIVLQIPKCQNVVVNSNSSNEEAVVIKNTNDTIKERLNQINYQLLTRNCFDEATCLSYIYVEQEFFNEKNLIELASFLNNKTENKERLRIFFFDNFLLAKAHTEGKKEPRDLENDAKGLFFHNKTEEFFKIRMSGKNSENWSGWNTVFIKKF